MTDKQADQLRQLLKDFHNEMTETEHDIEVDTYDGIDNTDADLHMDWISDLENGYIRKISRLLTSPNQA